MGVEGSTRLRGLRSVHRDDVWSLPPLVIPRQHDIIVSDQREMPCEEWGKRTVTLSPDEGRIHHEYLRIKKSSGKSKHHIP